MLSAGLATVLSAAVLTALLTAVPAAAQAPPPDATWRTFPTEHFRITYTPDLEPLARQAAGVAERTYAVLRDELGEPPSGTIDLVVTDHVDFSNGYATFFPSNRIVVYARPPAGVPQLAFSRDWLEMVVAHELVHIFHLDEAGRVGNAVRSVFGQVPMIWPLFPVAGSPGWNVEGLATWYESRLTGAGRAVGSYHRMIARTAALEDRIPPLDRLSTPHPAWPGGQQSYGYGALLMEHIAERFGHDAHREIVEATGASMLPTFIFFDHVAGNAVGVPFDEIFEEWRAEATRSSLEVAAELREAGLSPLEPVAGRGPFAAAPRVSPDGSLLSFASHDYRSDPETRIVDLATGRERTLARLNQGGSGLGPATWLPDGTGLIVAQLERHGPYRTFSDLWRLDLDGRERRLTRGERIAQPDVAPDGRRVAAVRSRRGGLQLVIHDVEDGETRVLVDADPGDAFDSPRWSPDGHRIAVTRLAAGGTDVVVVDARTGAITPLTDDDALDLSPTWSPDGEWVVWGSDRSGIPDILAARVPAAGAEPATAGSAGTASTGNAPLDVRQVTRVLTGAFDPEVSTDGRTLYLSVYHHDGWRIERTPFDPAASPVAPAGTLRHRPGILPGPPRGEAGAGGPAAAGGSSEAESKSYSPWATLRPFFWLPEFSSLEGQGGDLYFPGLYTRGRDLLWRHEWELSAGLDPLSWRARGYGSWTYRRFGPAQVTLSASRAWSRAGQVEVSDGVEAIYHRTDRAAADAIFWRSRWRGTGWLRAGSDIEWETLEAHDLSEAGLRDEGWLLNQPPTVAGISAGPGYSNARFHPYSISAESGISGSFSAGRWWDVSGGARAYDEVVGRLAGYLDFPVWGHADHVLAVRTAGLLRQGPDARATSIGGVPGGTGGFPAVAEEVLRFSGNAFFPARGFASGERVGTRAWSASGEWRFPLHMSARHGPMQGHVLGFSLTAISGALFTDVADAWCEPAEVEAIQGCAAPERAPLISAGAELSIDFGIFHNSPALLRMGLAQPIQGPGDARPSFYLSVGPSF